MQKYLVHIEAGFMVSAVDEEDAREMALNILARDGEQHFEIKIEVQDSTPTMSELMPVDTEECYDA